MTGTTIDQAIARVQATAWQDTEVELEGLEDFGSYTGTPPVIRLLDDGRKAELAESIAYHAAGGIDWPVPKDSILDGASIPRAFWTLIGGPFEGKYRNASIVHDHYCDHHHDRTWQDTARMFYAAMRCSGVGAIKAKIMFYAVYRFGPKWPDPLEESLGETRVDDLTDSKAASLLADVQAIAAGGLSLPQIETLADDRRHP